MADLKQFVSLQGQGLIGELKLGNFSSSNVFTEAQRLALNITKIVAGMFYTCEQTDGTQKGVWSYSGTRSVWIYLGSVASDTILVTVNPAVTAPTLTDDVNRVLWIETGLNSVERVVSFSKVAGVLRAEAQEPSVIATAVAVADLTKPNSFQTLTDGKKIFVSWDKQVSIISTTEDISEFTISPLTITAGVPFEVNVLAITGKPMTDDSAYEYRAEGSDNYEVELMSQSVDFNKFNLIADAGLTGGEVFVNTKLNF